MKKIFYHKRFCFFLCGLVLELSVFFKPRINIGNWFGVSSMVSVSLSLCVTSPCAFCPVVHSYSSMRSCAVCCRLLLLPLLSHTWEPQKVFSGGCPEPLAEVFVSDYGVLDALCSRNQTETHERSLLLLRKYSVLISGIQVTAEQPKLGVPCHVTCRSLPFPSSQMHRQASLTLQNDLRMWRSYQAFPLFFIKRQKRFCDYQEIPGEAKILARILSAL